MNDEPKATEPEPMPHATRIMRHSKCKERTTVRLSEAASGTIYCAGCHASFPAIEFSPSPDPVEKGIE